MWQNFIPGKVFVSKKLDHVMSIILCVVLVRFLERLAKTLLSYHTLVKNNLARIEDILWRICSGITRFYSCISFSSSDDQIHQADLRSFILDLQICINFYAFSFFKRTVNIWNSLPASVFF